MPVNDGLVLAATRNIHPGVILQIRQHTELPIFTRRADPRFQYVTSIATAQPPNGDADSGNIGTGTSHRAVPFFCNGVNERHVLVETGDGGRVIYTHNTYVREVAADRNNKLYFSEASGAGKDGVIYKFRYSGSTAIDVFYQVHRSEIGGFWAGNFAFGPDDALYLSNGNHQGAAIWRCPLAGQPQEIFRSKGTIMGFCFVDTGTVLYTDWTNRIYLLHVETREVENFHISSREDLQFSDVIWSPIHV